MWITDGHLGHSEPGKQSDGASSLGGLHLLYLVDGQLGFTVSES